MIVLWIGVGVAWLLGFAFLWQVPAMRPGRLAQALPRVSVIIPARNEEKNLAVLLPSLAQQAVRADEIWVVDDQSQDQTAAVAQQHGARVITAPALPPGWLGKPWACQQGADQASGEVLCFLDADCFFEPNGFPKLIDTFLRQPGVLSVSPYHQTRTWAEQFSAFFNLMQAAGLNAFTLLGNRIKPAGLFGPCLVIRKTDYQKIGGHAAVKNKILENYSLAQPLAQHGIRVNAYGGQGVLSVRLYPEGLRALIQGWGKSFAKGAGHTPPLTLGATIAWISGMITTTIFLLWTVGHAAWPAAGAWLVFYGLFAVQVRRNLKPLGNFTRGVAALFPLYVAFFLAVFLWSAVMNPHQAWKGRSMAQGE